MATKKKPLYSGAGTTGLGAFDLYGNAKQNKDALLSLQKFLNVSSPTTKIKEDGIWGTETQGAWDRFNASPSVVAQTTANTTMVPETYDYGNGARVGNPLATAAPSNLESEYTPAGTQYSPTDWDAAVNRYGTLSNGQSRIEAPTGLTMEQISADPEKYGSYDFSKNYGDGSLGTAPVQSNQWVSGLSNFETLHGVAGLGSLGMNLYGMFGSGGTKEVNKKNIELMDQQIANNRDIMRTRTERAGDIKKYFG